MDKWASNSRTKPYVYKKYKGSVYGLQSRDFFGKRCITKFIQAALIVVLVVTVAINLLFILDTSKKLQSITTPGKLPQKDIPRRIVTEKTNRPQSLSVDVVSSKERAVVTVGGITVLQDEGANKNRGIHIVVLNQETGSIMAKNVFDTYSPREDEAMVQFINILTEGRIIIFTIKDEGTYHLQKDARDYLTELGSTEIKKLNFRDMWAMIIRKGKGKIEEAHNYAANFSTWGERIKLSAEIPLVSLQESACPWKDSEENTRRKAFCSKIEGYGNVCSCDKPEPVDLKAPVLKDNKVSDIPVIVIASDRPQYLYRMLKTLLLTPGANKSMITIYIDGYFEEPLEVTKLLGLRGIQHTPLGMKNARISQHYKASLTATFQFYPTAEYVIIIEEDLDVSPNFFSYFSQTKHLLDEDESIYCISAWNDQGYNHSSHDPSILYRVETMPGLGWMLKKKLYKEELEPHWPTPEKQWDWDMWMRSSGIRKDRECIIPDISRTYHFGSKGLNMNPYFQEVYFKKHSIYSKPVVKLKDIDRMKKDEYEVLVGELIKSGVLTDHSSDPCSENLVPYDKKETYIMYIKRGDEKQPAWKFIAKCLHLWDLDVRGLHKGMWRLFRNGTPLIIIGIPESPYTKYKPENLEPFTMKSQKESS